MCGIVGVVHREYGRPVRLDAVRAMCTALRHRGPDDEGVWASGPVGLGMRRLSIIDLEGGRQPIWNEDRSAVIVFNGEIYNYKELYRELAARGHRFRTHSDTEAILHLWEDLGAACVDRLRGMFAFAIWSERHHTLLLARDRFGIKPLYYTASPAGLAFASELKALLAGGYGSADLDWPALDAYFQLGYVPAPATPFTHVRKLEPGHVLTWRDGGWSVRRYWDVPAQEAAAPADPARAVREWLDDSVAAHLVSDVPVAAFLSGGLDSSAVLASAAIARRGSPPPHAFTARYTGSGAAAADETALAAALAERYGARLTVVDIAPDIADTFEPLVQALDEPLADDSAIPTWELSRAVASSYKVALTGIGGDELFAGYRRHLGLCWAERYARLPQGLRRAAAAGAGLIPEPADGGLGVNRLKRFLRVGGGADAAALFLDIVSRVPDAERSLLYSDDVRSHALAGDGARARFDRLARAGGSRRGLAAGLYLDVKAYLSDDILALSDRMAMAHGLEVRVPLVDHVLMERVFPLPSHVKVGWRGDRKHLLKRALAPRLPAAHFHAPKRGFVGPTTAWLRNELRPMLTDELSASRLSRLGHFDPRAVGRLLDDHLQRRENREGILWALLCFSTWHRLYVETGAARPAEARRAAIRVAAGSPRSA